MQRIIVILGVGLTLCLVVLITLLVMGRDSGGVSEEDLAPYPVRGIDISSHNGPIDFDELSDAGIDFVFMKATEGGSFKDALFHRNFNEAKRTGLKVGVYHFFRFDATGYMQGLNLVHSLRGKQPDLPVVIDVEEWTNPAVPRDSVVSRLRALVSHLGSRGYGVMIYTNKNGYTDYIRGNFDDVPLWICSFTPVDPDVRWTFWQYSHWGSVPGIGRNTDLNVFGGSRQEWEEWCAGHSALVQ